MAPIACRCKTAGIQLSKLSKQDVSAMKVLATGKYNFSSLPRPTIIYSNHHLLAINKPAGWHSIPVNSDRSPSPSLRSSKCLLTYLKHQRLGGGSAHDFLRPVHRLDQPCTGIMMFAKNTKAASRIQTAWAKGQVMKEYLCVVEGTSMQAVRNRSVEWKYFERWAASRSDVLLKQCEWGSAGWRNKEEARVLTGIIRKRPNGSKGSVMVESIDLRLMEQNEQKQPDSLESGIENNVVAKGGRMCHLEYRHLASFPDRRRGTSNQVHLVSVRTATGARHQVRALLAAVGSCPIVGDIRYGSIKPALRDQSVALHARSLYMPTVKLGGTDLIRSPFTAPVPSVWQEFFALSEDDVQRLQN